MSTEIKIRAWDKSLKKYHYPKLWDSSMPGNWKDWYELELFMDLYDMKGNDIYVGDIVGCYGNLSKKVIEPYILVEFKNGHCNIGPESQTDYIIIGNKHQNNELLKESIL